MDSSTIYAKTQKGREEIATRAYRIVPRLRTLLIVVDGQSTVGELIEKAQSLGGIAPMLAELERHGFIEAVTGRSQR